MSETLQPQTEHGSMAAASLGEVEKPKRALPRIESMDVLPLFHKLQGAHVLLAGKGPAAAWKAELLAAAGATVHVYAEKLGPSFEPLMQGQWADQIVHHVEAMNDESFKHVRLAFCVTNSDEEALAFRELAKKHGVPVNVVDRPDYCDFQTGSIVNRSPVVIGISTSGGSPILGQAIRQRIEVLLPGTLTEWARLAVKVRARVHEYLDFGTPRRQFWNRFASRALSGDSVDVTPELLVDQSFRIQESEKGGQVTLVGAGPGDADLLSIKALRALQAADVILYDDLVSSDVLELARREAKRMLVGKRGRRESCRQDDINAQMIKFAKAGRNVVRLKGGDPTIFGRGGEELAALKSQGIPVTIVPGITSASAMAARLGVSLTHRDHAQSVRYITGHSRKGILPADIDWQAAADSGTTLVVYMGGRTVEEVVDRLIARGRCAETPAAVVSAVTREDEVCWCGTLGELAENVNKIGFEQPVLIGIGGVFAEASERFSTDMSERRVAVSA